VIASEYSCLLNKPILSLHCLQAPLWDMAALEMLRTLAEEAGQMPGPRRKAVVEGMYPQSPTVFSFLATRTGNFHAPS
jgi:hypothetical protein